MAEAQLKITLVRSLIGTKEPHRKTVRALGLRHRLHSVIQKDTPQIRGMINKVGHLIEVETL